MAFCKYCGSQIQDDSVFCSNCGRKLNGSAQSVQYPPPPKPEHQITETAEQRAQRYQNGSYQNNTGYVNTGGSGGSAPKNSSMKFIIPAVIVAFIVVLLIFNRVSNRNSSSGVTISMPTSSPSISISVPTDLINVKPTIDLPENFGEPTDKVGYDEGEFFESIGDNVLAVLKAITERSDYVLGDFEPLIGVTNVNKNGRAEILAVYETKDDNSYKVSYDVWSADAQLTYRVMSGILYFEIGGNGGVVYLLQDSSGAPYVMLEQSMVSGEYFQVTFYLYKFSSDETTIDSYGAWEAEGRYDTEHGGIAEAKYSMLQSDWVEVSAEEFMQSLDGYTTVYSLDIVSGEYDWDNTLSFDWAWKTFGQER